MLPSARPVAEVNARMDKWRAQGYKVALWRDAAKDWFGTNRTAYWQDCDAGFERPIADTTIVSRWYPGYSEAVNYMADWILGTLDPHCDWIVATGDDTDPDPNHAADNIAFQCGEYFISTFGVMQPTGDDWRDAQGRIIERIAGSPWLGREWCLRINGGRGPLWPEYTHCFADEELQHVATKLGVFWQRPDLTHYHDHWARPRGNPADMPAFLSEATSPQHWQKYGQLFTERLAAGFPGHEPLAITSHVR